MPRPRKQVTLSPARKPTSLEESIKTIVAAAMQQVAEAVREGIAEQLRQTMGGGSSSSPTAAPGAAPFNGGAPKPRKGGRARLLDDGTIERIYDVVKSSPGLRSEQVMKQLPFTPKLVKLALAKLREAKRIKMKGQKRGATYTA
jgi:hypothetical protein